MGYEIINHVPVKFPLDTKSGGTDIATLSFPAPKSCAECKLTRRDVTEDENWGTYDFFRCTLTGEYVGAGGKFYVSMTEKRAPFCPLEIVSKPTFVETLREARKSALKKEEA